jgi:hypothetical protein
MRGRTGEAVVADHPFRRCTIRLLRHSAACMEWKAQQLADLSISYPQDPGYFASAATSLSVRIDRSNIPEKKSIPTPSKHRHQRLRLLLLPHLRLYISDPLPNSSPGRKVTIEAITKAWRMARRTVRCHRYIDLRPKPRAR